MALKKYIRLLTCLLLILVSAQSIAGTTALNTGGLRFSSKDVYSSQRTSLRLFDAYRHVPRSFNLKFSCSIYDPKMFGFVFRAMHEDGSNPTPLMYLLFVPAQGNSDSCVFEFHISNSETTVRFELDPLQLNNILFEVQASVKDNYILFKCNDAQKRTEFAFPREMNINFLFGLYGENTDVAPMVLRNLQLELNDQSRFYWPLNESGGNTAHDVVNKLESTVMNPTWLQDKHYYWEKLYSLNTDPMAGIVQDESNNLLFLNKDSLIIYDPHNNRVVNILKYNVPRPFERDAFFAVFNPKTSNIIAYDFHFLKVNDGQKTFSVYDRNANAWSPIDSTVELDQNHHHSVFWNRDTTRLITFGGYSYFHYYNTFRSFDFTTGFWEEISLSGDEIYPRTHAAISRDRFTGQYYLFGGFGNKEGSQSMEGRYFYDLYTIDPESRIIDRIWDMSSPGFDFVPRGNLIFRPDEEVCYVLGNPPIENSNMRLYEVNLKEPKIKIASDSIPVIFSDMSGNAFLFLNLNENELYCVTRETTNHSYAATTIYKLSFPPSDIIVNEVSSPPKRSWFRILLIILAIVATGYILYIFRFHRHKIRTIHQRIAGVEKFERNKRNAIWLLNEFKVFDKNGRDISYRFATKVRHAFLILFFENYFNDGIVSSDFSNILWPMLDKDQQKNNRGVIMNNLRKIFEDISEIALVKETMKWKVIFGPGVYIDFLEIHKALLSDRNDENNETILNYLSLGSLLPAESWEYLDRYKDRYSAAAIEILLDLARDAFHHHNFMKAIEISDIVLNYFDFLSETALVYKIKSLFILKNSAKAVTEYNKFRLKYNESISKNFQNSLDDILNMTLPTENY